MSQCGGINNTKTERKEKKALQMSQSPLKTEKALKLPAPVFRDVKKPGESRLLQGTNAETPSFAEEARLKDPSPVSVLAKGTVQLAPVSSLHFRIPFSRRGGRICTHFQNRPSTFHVVHQQQVVDRDREATWRIRWGIHESYGLHSTGLEEREKVAGRYRLEDTINRGGWAHSLRKMAKKGGGGGDHGRVSLNGFGLCLRVLRTQA
ncbi:hypothetical protein QBC45DRAFT_409583 [Copromyces sp. CBS 386.78]|nr:hypothetical protein QBC45DRAFT_409583 [Copromyces sp. CBS 386.78]